MTNNILKPITILVLTINYLLCNFDGLYDKLPTKHNLCYFQNPKNDVGNLLQVIDQIHPSTMISKEENYDWNFNIDKDSISVIFKAKIDASGIGEFELDDFEKNLKKSLKLSLDSISYNYVQVDKHIRIVNLKIPVKYTKIKPDLAGVLIQNDEGLSKLNCIKSLSITDFINHALGNSIITQYIVPTTKKYKFASLIDTSVNMFQPKLIAKIEAFPGDLNDIGKKNKGKDFITELTLHIWRATGGSEFAYKSLFLISSFKLKSSNERFVLDTDLDNLKNMDRRVFSILGAE